MLQFMPRQSKNGKIKTCTVHVAVPVPLLKKIRRIARGDDRTVNYTLGLLLKESVAVREERSSQLNMHT